MDRALRKSVCPGEGDRETRRRKLTNSSGRGGTSRNYKTYETLALPLRRVLRGRRTMQIWLQQPGTGAGTERPRSCGHQAQPGARQSTARGDSPASQGYGDRSERTNRRCLSNTPRTRCTLNQRSSPSRPQFCSLRKKPRLNTALGCPREITSVKA